MTIIRLRMLLMARPYWVALTFFLTVLLPFATIAQPDSQKISGFLDFNMYPYTSKKRNTVFTLNALANLPHRFQYYSLNNLSRKTEENDWADLDTYFTEQSLRWKPDADIPLQLTIQAILRSRSDNDLLRLGTRWAAHETPGLKEILNALSFRYWLSYHAIQFDYTSGYQWQIEQFYYWNIAPESLDNRLYIKGFADFNIDHRAGDETAWNIESQLGVRLVDSFYLVSEFRHNDFRLKDKSTLAAGLEYIYHFQISEL